MRSFWEFHFDELRSSRGLEFIEQRGLPLPKENSPQHPKSGFSTPTATHCNDEGGLRHGAVAPCYCCTIPKNQLRAMAELPLSMEPFFALCFLACLQALLYEIVWMPVQAVVAIIKISCKLCLKWSTQIFCTLMRTCLHRSRSGCVDSSSFSKKRTEPLDCGALQRHLRLTVPEICDLTRIIVGVAGVILFTRWVDVSDVYHFIRAQSLMKLYVVFNMLEIVERMCRSTGKDAIDSLLRHVFRSGISSQNVLGGDSAERQGPSSSVIEEHLEQRENSTERKSHSSNRHYSSFDGAAPATTLWEGGEIASGEPVWDRFSLLNEIPILGLPLSGHAESVHYSATTSAWSEVSGGSVTRRLSSSRPPTADVFSKVPVSLAKLSESSAPAGVGRGNPLRLIGRSSSLVELSPLAFARSSLTTRPPCSPMSEPTGVMLQNSMTTRTRIPTVCRHKSVLVAGLPSPSLTKPGMVGLIFSERERWINGGVSNQFSLYVESQERVDLKVQSLAPLAARRLTIYTVLVLFYLVLHSLIHLIRVLLLNMSINSSDSIMFLIVTTNNFAEIKSTVFKKMNRHTLYVVAVSDAVERFYLACDTALVFLHLRAAPRFPSARESFRLLFPWFIRMMILEILVDWVKHGFLLKVNPIEADVFRKYRATLIADIIAARAPDAKTADKFNSSPAEDRGGTDITRRWNGPSTWRVAGRGCYAFPHTTVWRLGFIALPLTTQFWMCFKKFVSIEEVPLHISLAILAATWMCLLCALMCCSAVLLAYAESQRHILWELDSSLNSLTPL